MLQLLELEDEDTGEKISSFEQQTVRKEINDFLHVINLFKFN